MHHNKFGLRHLTGLGPLEGKRLLRKHFPQQVLDELVACIARSEQDHAGEVVLAIEAVAPSHELDSHQRNLPKTSRAR